MLLLSFLAHGMLNSGTDIRPVDLAFRIYTFVGTRMPRPLHLFPPLCTGEG
jgi:hypothetical protein